DDVSTFAALAPQAGSPARPDRRGATGVSHASLPDGSKISPQANPAAASLLRGGAPSCPQIKSLSFEPLPGASLEVREISALWSKGYEPDPGGENPAGATARQEARVVVLSGVRATEAAVKEEAGRARVLHIATHGF